MPPANQQGSKPALVTALVIFVMLFVVSAVFAIYYGVQFSDAQQAAKAEQMKVNRIATQQQIGDPTIQALAGANGVTAIETLQNQRDSVIKEITGSVTDVPTATKAADEAIASAQAQVKKLNLDASIRQSDLVGAIGVLSHQLEVLAGQTAAAKQAQAAAEADATKAHADADAQVKAAQAKVDDAAKQVAKIQAESEAKDKETAANIASIRTADTNQLTVYSKAIQTMQQAESSLNQKIANYEKLIKAFEARIARYRIDPKESVIQQADGKIVRIADANTVFIDIGHQQGVTPGLTFEVYDPNKGIPPLGDGQRNDDLPIGIASLEVTHVLSDTSECRVTRTTPGQALVPGDCIMNLVFDPHTKYKFVVYGDFDLNQTNQPNAADAAVIKRLVSQWGGELQPAKDLNTNTDFLVLGTEPVVPTLSDDDKSNPQAVKRHDDAQAALDAYDNIRQKAIEYGIPILNQNRFLYYTGYYDLAQQ